MTDDTKCSNCEESIGYEVGWDDPPEGEGHLEVQWNPADEPAFVVAETRRYCSIDCLLQEVHEIPFNHSLNPDTDRSDPDA